MDARYEQRGMRVSEARATWAGTVRTRPIATAAILIAVVGAATILGAWFFQLGLGLKPCPLCLEQRYPYYFAIPLAVLVLLGVSAGGWGGGGVAGLSVLAR